MKSDKKFLHHQARANNIFLPSYEFIIRKNKMWGPEGDKVDAGSTCMIFGSSISNPNLIASSTEMEF